VPPIKRGRTGPEHAFREWLYYSNGSKNRKMTIKKSAFSTEKYVLIFRKNRTKVISKNYFTSSFGCNSFSLSST
jgi:hypothetical protein